METWTLFCSTSHLIYLLCPFLLGRPSWVTALLRIGARGSHVVSSISASLVRLSRVSSLTLTPLGWRCKVPAPGELSSPEDQRARRNYPETGLAPTNTNVPEASSTSGGSSHIALLHTCACIALPAIHHTYWAPLILLACMVNLGFTSQKTAFIMVTK